MKGCLAYALGLSAAASCCLYVVNIAGPTTLTVGTVLGGASNSFERPEPDYPAWRDAHSVEDGSALPPSLVQVERTGHTFTIPLKEYVTVFDGPALPGSGSLSRHRRLHVTEYYGRVSFGEPAQVFDMVFDTGSGNIVLPTVKCVDEACQKHRRFVSADSKTAVQLAYDDGTKMLPGDSDRDTTTITYGTGKLTGEYVQEHVCMGQSGASASFCTDVNFLGVTQESRFPFVELPFDGIFGLGLAGLSAGSSFNFVSRMRSNHSIGDPTFAVFLRDLDADEESEITFGGYRPERFQDAENGMKWLPVSKEEADSKGYWLVTMREVYVRGRPMGFCNDPSRKSRCQVAMDTGSSLIMGPPVAVDQLLRAMGGCSEGNLPPLRFEFDAAAGGTFDVVLQPRDYAEFDADGSCATSFQPLELPPTLGPMWILGQTALRKYYSVYDAKRWRVGLGLARHASRARPSVAASSSAGATAADLQQGRSPREACVDSDAEMAAEHLPGCRSFTNMGYCMRFPPLAHHYCRLSCGFCKTEGSSDASTVTDVSEEDDAVPAARASVVPPADAVSVAASEARPTRSFLRVGRSVAASINEVRRPQPQDVRAAEPQDGEAQVTLRGSGLSVSRYVTRRPIGSRRADEGANILDTEA
eukprot:TRINITY_DN1558_c0_g3_i1.p1 TRINITY_DN1558_c0_g3~~TRINITY_DN1558_c0_g3_i1.p1  ORF type:complete len:643 (-),score=100.21 TRINITY_DN1558_c0_g3_i1:67-1995(-)